MISPVPGHMYPLRYEPGGVLKRAGHTEAAVDLARMSGQYPAGVLAEVMNDDGSVARLPELERFAEEHGLLIGTIADLIAFRRREEKLVERVVEARIPTDHGTFTAVGYRSLVDDRQHMALVMGDLGDGESVLTRVHSECLTGDVFGSLRCDCGDQLDQAMATCCRGGPRCRPLHPGPRGPGHRVAPQAGGIQAPGRGVRHRRCQRESGAARRCPGLRGGCPNPVRPRACARCGS